MCGTGRSAALPCHSSDLLDKLGNIRAEFLFWPIGTLGCEPLRARDLDRPRTGRLLSTQSVEIVDISGPEARGCFLASLDPTQPDDLNALVVELQRLLQGMRHGSVTLIVQDGRVVQLDATHKVRLAGATAPRRPNPRS